MIKTVKSITTNMQRGAYDVTNSITTDTTLEEWLDILRHHPEYKLHYGGRIAWNALGVACNKQNYTIVKWFMDLPNYKDYIDLGNGNGWTPLYCLFKGIPKDEKVNDHILTIVELLLEKGADPNIKPADNCTCLRFACLLKSPELANMLIHFGAILDSNEDEDALRELLQGQTVKSARD